VLHFGLLRCMGREWGCNPFFIAPIFQQHFLLAKKTVIFGTEKPMFFEHFFEQPGTFLVTLNSPFHP
jgi:hypothetical protein